MVQKAMRQKQMRILLIHTKLVSGGIEAIVCNLANEMAKENDVTVCTIFKPSKNDVFYARLHPSVKKISLGKVSFGFSIKELFKIAKLFGKGEYDVVHVHGCFQYYALAALLYHKKTRIVYTIHSDAKMENQTWDKRLFRFKKFCFCKKWIEPVTISPSSQKSFYDLYHCSSTLVENGIIEPRIDADLHPLREYRHSVNTIVFIHPGRISKAKNQIVLCEVFDSLIKQGFDVVLIIAGMAEEQSIFKQIQPFFQRRIVYLGERNDVPQLMCDADAFCLPSIWEGLPVTLLEALSVGCVPICSPVGGIVNVITDNEDGILSKSPAKNDYEEAVKRFLQLDLQTKKALSRAAKLKFDEYRIERTAGKYIKLYKR